MLGYHFTSDRLLDGRPLPAIGEWLEHAGPIVPCKSGLHISEHPFDAMRYGPGTLLHRVELDGELVPHGDPVVDKWVGRRRRILASIGAAGVLRDFARRCAKSVVHLWDAPDVVRKYLDTGDESLHEASRNATWPKWWVWPLQVAKDQASVAATQACALFYLPPQEVWIGADAAAQALSLMPGAPPHAEAVAAQRAEFARMVDSAFAAKENT